MAEPLLLGQYHDAVIAALKKLTGCGMRMPILKKCAAIFWPGHACGVFHD